jgi:hypothetical protein
MAHDDASKVRDRVYAVWMHGDPLTTTLLAFLRN